MRADDGPYLFHPGTLHRPSPSSTVHRKVCASRSDRRVARWCQGGAGGMVIPLHENATTTPGIRRRLSGSDDPAAVLAPRHGVSEETARKWKRRDSVQDLSATRRTPCKRP